MKFGIKDIFMVFCIEVKYFLVIPPVFPFLKRLYQIQMPARESITPKIVFFFCLSVFSFIYNLNISIWSCIYLFIYFEFSCHFINKTEPHCRVTTTLLTIWVSQLVFFQHHVMADQRGWCCHMTQAPPPAIRSHQTFGSWACSSQPPPLRPPTYIRTTVVHFKLSTNHLLYPFYALQSAVSMGTAAGLHQSVFFTPPKIKQEKKSTATTPPPQPLTKQLLKCNICIMWQFLSAIRPPSPSVWLPCVISILSKPQKIVSCFYPAFCSYYILWIFQSSWAVLFFDQVCLYRKKLF